MRRPSTPSAVWDAIAPRVAGAYFLYEGTQLVYIGRSSNIRTRMKSHELRDEILSGQFKLFVVPMSESAKAKQESGQWQAPTRISAIQGKEIS